MDVCRSLPFRIECENVGEHAVLEHCYAFQKRQRFGVSAACSAQAGQILQRVGMVGMVGADRVVVASDGLTEMVPEPEIARLLAANPEPKAAAEALLAAALDAGGSDNVTVIVAHCRLPQA